jgi:hypothetical protein
MKLTPLMSYQRLRYVQDNWLELRNKAVMMGVQNVSHFDMNLIQLQDEMNRAELREKYLKDGCGCMVRIKDNGSSDKPLGLYVSQDEHGLVEIALDSRPGTMPYPNVFMHRSQLEYYLDREWRDLYLVERDNA